MLYCASYNPMYRSPNEKADSEEYRRLALVAALRLEPGGLMMMAPVCSSFSDMCASQSGRSIVCPLGDTSLPWVRTGNLLAHRCRLRIGRYAIVLTDAEFVSVYNKPTSSCGMGRCVLLCYLAMALNLCFILEQPASAKFSFLPQWEHFCEQVAWVAELRHTGCELTATLSTGIIYLDACPA